MKIYRSSQIPDVLGRSVHALEMYRYGLPFLSAAGVFSESLFEGSVDLMLVAAEIYSNELHPVSFMKEGHAFNKYVDGAFYYRLFRGNADPDIQFTKEFSMADYKPGELERDQKEIDEILARKPSFEAAAAMKWRFW